MLVGAAMLGLAFLADRHIGWWFEGPQPKLMRDAARAISFLGDWPTLIISATVVGLIGFLMRRNWTRIVLLMVIAASLAGVTANISRSLTGRTRPSSDISQGWYGPPVGKHHKLARHETNSFPSAHTTTAMAFFITLLILAPDVGFWFLPAPFLIGASRLALGVHHFSDVCAGLILGTLIAFFTCHVLAPYWTSLHRLWRKVHLPELESPETSS